MYFIIGTAYAGKSTMVKMLMDRLEVINSENHYQEYDQSGFFTLVREDNGQDTRKGMCEKLAKHFGFTK